MLRTRRIATLATALILTACTGTSTPDAGHDGAIDARTDGSLDARIDAPADTLATDDAPVDAPNDAPAVDPLDPSLAPAVDTNPASYPSNVWITGPLVKLTPSAMPGTTHWAFVSAARNEIESFQVHVRAGTASLALDVTMSDLTAAHGTTVIAGADHVFVSREAYLDITRLSDANGTLGRLPDPLVPSRDRYFHEARNAFPVTIPAGETRSAWIDVHVPAGTPSGYYSATVTVRDGSNVVATLPVRLAVWNFELPSTATLASTFGMSWNGLCTEAYGGYAQCGMFPGGNGDADRGTERTHIVESTFFLDHRVTIGDTVYAAPRNTDWTAFDAAYGPLMNGTASTLLTGAHLTALRYSQTITDVPSIQRWVDHFSALGWSDRLFFYHCDEPPNGCSFTTAQTESTSVHGSTPPGRYLLTTDIAHSTTNNMLDAIDTMVPVVDYMHPRRGTDQRPLYDAWLARRSTNRLWWYQSCDQHEACSAGAGGGAQSTWPSYMVDASPVRNRVFQWLAYLYDVRGELYYATDYCWHGTCGGDVWNTVYAFGGNGDGTLFYPGTPARIGGTTPIPVSSIRLEHIRDGMEDYEYLRMLAAAGDAAFAERTSRTIITNAFTFDNDPDHYMAARRALGDRLHQMAR